MREPQSAKLKAIVPNMLIFGLLILAAGCTSAQTRKCSASVSDIERNEIKEILRPHIEFVRSFDGYIHTLENELVNRELSVFDCGQNYEAKFTTRAGVVGSTTTFVIDKATEEVIDAFDDQMVIVPI